MISEARRSLLSKLIGFSVILATARLYHFPYHLTLNKVLVKNKFCPSRFKYVEMMMHSEKIEKVFYYIGKGISSRIISLGKRDSCLLLKLVMLPSLTFMNIDGRKEFFKLPNSFSNSITLNKLKIPFRYSRSVIIL